MAFTAIDGDTSWQDLAIAQEIATSYNRRRSLCGLSTISTPSEATDVFSFIYALQAGIEQMANNLLFVNNTGALSGFEGLSSYPNKMGLSTAMTAAGLISSGYWRRIAQGGTQPTTWTNYSATGWSYGKIQDKDLAGPWLFKDIQVAMSALTRAKIVPTEYRKKELEVSYSSSSMPSTTLTFGSWTTGESYSRYYAQKNKTSGNVVNYVDTWTLINEFRFDISSVASACESARLILTIPQDAGYDSYSTYTGKKTYSNLTVSDVTTVFNKTVGNSSSVSSGGGVSSYASILGEDASNIIPLFNDVLPDAKVSASNSINIGVSFYYPCLIIDFTFE